MLHAATVALLVLHTVDGRDVDVNPAAITSLRRPQHSDENIHHTRGAHCMVSLTDGKFIAVIETCDQVREMIK